ASGLRRRPRVPLEVEVGLSGDNTFFAGLSMDVVDGGLFVATWQALPVGTLVEVSLVLPGGHAVTAPGVVVFVIDEREELSPGMGITLSGLAPQHLDAIRRFCKQRPPTYYDMD
ncbi:MAG TPA: PilZ domain-containing protein, partial [Polyangiaceae bacterium]|nr:PilZ domain-containing protein [Polyangiaceae bacterium]